jgi:hypothetical protein
MGDMAISRQLTKLSSFRVADKARTDFVLLIGGHFSVLYAKNCRSFPFCWYLETLLSNFWDAHCPHYPFAPTCDESEARFLASFESPCIKSTIIANR